jgi:hypothetical protein
LLFVVGSCGRDSWGLELIEKMCKKSKEQLEERGKTYA